MSNSMMKEAALKYAEHGFSVFPLNGKIPAIKGGHGHQDASSDETQIASWFDDGDYQHCNIGLAIPDNIWVLDVDIRPDIDGSKSLASLTEQHGELPPTVTQITGSGGRHLLFKRNGADFGCSGSRIGPGLDVKTKDGYVVVAPSIHPYTGNAYRWEDGKAPWECEIVEAPEWLEQLAVKPEYETPIIQQMDSDHATSVPEAYGKAALADECQKILNAANGTQQQTLNEASFKIGTLVGAGALDQFEASNTLIEAGCSMQSFKSTNRWAPQNVKKIVDQGLADGMKRPRVLPEPVNDWPNQSFSSSKEQLIDDLNQRHAVIMISGKCVVINEDVDPITGRKSVSFSHMTDFVYRYANQFVEVNEKSIPLGKYWFTHPDRREYDGITFAPEGTLDNYYNLWRGFAVEPKPGDCSLYLNHIRDVLASGNDEIYEYILNFMADAVQNPTKRPGVALVLRGKKGTGKGKFMEFFGQIFGNHYLQISNSRYLLGNFNSMLADALVVFADEAFWAGDKRQEGTLKALITEDTHIIEYKGKDAFQTRNLTRLVVASNDDWVIPAGGNERRYCVLDVSDHRLKDYDYFQAIDDEMENGGLEALMYHLKNRDLTNVNLRKYPNTSALTDQKINSMDLTEKWILDKFVQGYVLHPDEEWGSSLPKEVVRDDYLKFSKDVNLKSHGGMTQFTQKLKNLLPSGFDYDGKPSLKDEFGPSKRTPCYKFPPLDQCRKHFEAYFETEFEWLYKAEEPATIDQFFAPQQAANTNNIGISSGVRPVRPVRVKT